MKVPFLDIGATYKELKIEIDRVVNDVLNKGWYILGENAEGFEKEFATTS